MKIKLPLVALGALLFAGLPLASSSAYVAVSVGIAPPAIPIYQQPYCPAPGYIWTPGYWDWADFGYYWVPGVWVAPPRIGFLWTPGYWGYYGGRYRFNPGYWGPTVGFYGGINYGFGYGGQGYYGGEWSGNTFRYNTAVTRVNTTVIHNTYVNNTVVTNTGSRAGFNGPGGANAKPTTREQAAAKATHIPPTSVQRSRVEAAKKDPALHAKNNKGKPAPDAVQAFNRSNGRQAAVKSPPTVQKQAKAGEQAGSQKKAKGAQHRGPEQARGEAVKTAKRPPPKTQANRVSNATTPRPGQSSQAKYDGRTSKKTVPHQAVKHPPSGASRPQPASARQPAPTAHRGAPAHAEQPNKKNKKKHGEEPPGGG